MMITSKGNEVVCAPFKCKESHLRLCASISITSKNEHILLLGPNTSWKKVTAELLGLVSHCFYWRLWNHFSTGQIITEVWKAPLDRWPMDSLHQQFLQMPFRVFVGCGHQCDSYSHVTSPINRSNTPDTRSPIISSKKSETAMEEWWMEWLAALAPCLILGTFKILLFAIPASQRFFFCDCKKVGREWRTCMADHRVVIASLPEWYSVKLVSAVFNSCSSLFQNLVKVNAFVFPTWGTESHYESSACSLTHAKGIPGSLCLCTVCKCLSDLDGHKCVWLWFISFAFCSWPAKIWAVM